MDFRIIVLGDSSSSGIGWGRACYPYKLFKILESEAPIEVVNYAVPGFTSADASRFMRAVVATQRSDCLVVYLGNNEGAVGGPKGRYRPFRTALRERLFKQPARRFNPVLSPPRARFTYDVRPPILAASPDEFRANLGAIVAIARRRATPVVLVNPIANAAFPCGLGAPNSSYFCYLDGLDVLGDAPEHDPIDAASAALVDGLQQFARGDPARAVTTWQAAAAADDVAGFIARHNIACAEMRLGASDCIAHLRSLLGRYERYDSTVLYNLALMTRMSGRSDEAERLHDAAIEKDHAVYRIRHAYRAVIAEFAAKPGVAVLDLKDVVAPRDFVDYCHPTSAGHDKIAHAMAPLVRRHLRPTGSARESSYTVQLPSPNFVRSPTQSLYDYYCIDWPIAPERVTAALDVVMSRPPDAPDDGLDEIERCVANFRRVNAEHPAFTGNLRLSGAAAPRSHEILTCPENYLYRLMHNYMAAFEAGAMAGRLRAAAGIEAVRFSAADYKRMILHVNQEDLALALDTRPEYYRAVVAKIVDRLQSTQHIFQVVIGGRIRRLMSWYTREVFRYGTHSRLSMLYPRMDIEKLVEGLVVAIVIAAEQGEGSEFDRLDALLAGLLALLDAHERHVGLYHDRSPGFSVEAYQAELDDVRQRLRARCEAWGTA